MTRIGSRWLGGLVLVLATPAVAWANAGTPLLWAGAFHLVFGNAVIGVLEGLVLARLLGRPRLRAVLIMVVANYASAWAGAWLVLHEWAGRVDLTIGNLSAWICVLVAAAFLLTLAVEYPFIRHGIGGRRAETAGGGVACLRPVLIVNLVSYLLMLGGYWSVSGTSLLTGFEVVAPESLGAPADLRLYHLSNDGTRIFRRDLRGGMEELLRPTPLVSPEDAERADRLFARPDASGKIDLWLLVQSAEPVGMVRQDPPVLVQADFASAAGIDATLLASPPREVEDTWFNFGDAALLVGEQGSEWRFESGFWPLEGLSGRNSGTREQFHLSLETPLVRWPVRDVVQLEGDLLVFQLGRDQICLLDPHGKRIALLARGRGLVVARPR